MAKKILVTGATGYIGSHTLVDLIENGYEPVSVDSEFNSDAKVLKAVEQITGYSTPHYKVDLCNLEDTSHIFREHSFEGVIHFAALKAVGESVEQPFRYFRNNLDSLLNILQLSEIHGIKAFIFSSSCTVYGNAAEIPVTETTPWQEAESPYGRTKQMGEQIIHDCLCGQQMQAVLLRYFNPAGAHPSALMGESPINPPQNLVPVITETAIGKREKMHIFGSNYPTRDGTNIRDYIHVMDLAHAHTLALQHILNGKQNKQVDIYNLGIGHGVSVKEMVDAFESATGAKLQYEMSQRRPGDVVAIYANYEKAAKELGWKPQYSVEDIVRTAWEWEKKRTQFG
jgi:UDP-glucose 4-epimerase